MHNIIRLLSDAVNKGVFTCASYIIGTSERDIQSGHLGILGLDRGAATKETLYDLASVTKVLVSIAFMRLFEQGKFCLDDTVAIYLPSYVGGNKASITVRELLTHTSVIHGQAPLYQSSHSKEDLLNAILYLPVRDNSTVEYSSQGMIVIGEIMEAIEGKRLDKIVDEQLFQPLGLKNSMFNPPERMFGRIASTENCPWRGRVVCGQVHDENAVVLGGICAHAGIFSDISDLAVIARTMLTGRSPDGKQYLYNATRALMTRNHTAKMNLSRGLGWQCKDEKNSPAGDLFSTSSYGHTGFTGTSIWIDPDREMFAILLTNRVHPSRDGDGIVRVRHIFHNLSVLAVEESQK